MYFFVGALKKPIISIGDWAFTSCIGIKTVTIPSSVTTIGYGAFADCTATIYCEAQTELIDWNKKWNGEDYKGKVIFNSIFNPDLGTAINESASNAVNIYAYGKTIVVENATDEICVYDAMGKLVCRDAINRIRAEITINGTGVYIVKTGNVAKKVMVK